MLRAGSRSQTALVAMLARADCLSMPAFWDGCVFCLRVLYTHCDTLFVGAAHRDRAFAVIKTSLRPMCHRLMTYLMSGAKKTKTLYYMAIEQSPIERGQVQF